MNESSRSLSATEPPKLGLELSSRTRLPGGSEKQFYHLGIPESSERVFSKLGCSDMFLLGHGCLPVHCRSPGREAGFGDGLFGFAFVFLQNY